MSAVDEFDLVDAASPAPHPRRARLHGRAPWLVCAAALTLVGVVAAPAGGLPPRFPPGQVGTLAVDLSTPPDQVWSVPLPSWDSGAADLVLVGDVLVVLAEDAIGLDLASGTELWRLNVNTSRCAVRDAVVCIDRTGQAPAVLRVDPRAGTFEWHQMNDAITAVDFGDDLLVVRGDRAAQELQRIDAAGSLRWQRALPQLAGSDPQWRDGVRLTVLGPEVVVSGATTLSLEVETGAEVESPFSDVEAFGTGAIGFREDGTLALLDSEGRVTVTRLLTVPDDDPHSSVTATRPLDEDDQLTVMRDGVVLWSAPEWAAARVGGVLVGVDWTASTTTARVAGTGTVLWQRPDALGTLTAGGRTIVAAPGVGAGPLSGIDVRTGETLWSIGTAVTPYPYALLPDGLCVIGDGQLIRLRWSLGHG